MVWWLGAIVALTLVALVWSATTPLVLAEPVAAQVVPASPQTPHAIPTLQTDFAGPEGADGDDDGSASRPGGQAETRAAGAGQPSPFDVSGEANHAPLRRYAGRTIVLQTDTRNDYAVELLTKLDSFLGQASTELSRALDVASQPKPTQIIVFESQERYQDYARQHAPGLVNNGGYYDGGMRTVVTYRFNNSMQLYFHELVHAMMGEQFADHHFSRYTRKNWPIWFDEGIAEYLGSFEVVGTGIRIPAQNKGKLAYLANAIANNVFIDLPSLLRAPPERFSGASMNIYYAESWGLLDFLLHSPLHKPKVAQFFRKIRQGEDGIAAFKASFGEDLTSIDAAWRVYIHEATRPAQGWVPLFSGESIDDWTIHEGGQWRAGQGEIRGQGDRNYNYLIKSEVPMTDLSYELDLQLQQGTAGLILGNNFHGEYPYYYLIEIARDAVLLKRAWSASQIEPVVQAYAEIPLGQWVHIRVQIVDRVLHMTVGGKEIITTRVDRDRYSLFGLYLYRAKVRFRNVQVHNEAVEPKAIVSTPVPAMTAVAATAGGPAATPGTRTPVAASPSKGSGTAAMAVMH
jgi:hypothetical protein